MKKVYKIIYTGVGMAILFLFMSKGATAQSTDHYDHSFAFSQRNKKSALQDSNPKITLKLRDVSLEKALKAIARKAQAGLYYKSELLPSKKISLHVKAIPLSDVLHQVLQNTALKVATSGRNIMLQEKEDILQRERIQLTTVNGRVTNIQTGKSLPGANILVKNTSTGAITDSTGHYSVEVNSLQDTLIISYVGYVRKVVPINGRTRINIKLKPTTVSSNNLVVVGYGTQQEQDVNGAVSTIDQEEIENVPQVSVSQLLQGRAAGVTVTQNSGMPGGAASVRIRGITSITGNNEPLYVIDGVPVSGDANNSATSGRSVANNYSGQGTNTVSPLSGLNPNDIESINILKDASAEAIYGSRGANGVVIITTKSGSSSENKISYSGYVGSQQPETYLDLMELPQYARLTNYLSTLYGQEPNQRFSRPELLGDGTDWQKAIFQNALMQNHQLAFSGGNDDITYYISGGYLNKDGIVLGSKFNRYTLKTNIDVQVTDWFKAGVKLNGSSSDQDLPINGSATGAVNLALSSSPAQPVYNVDGTFAGPHRSTNGTIIGQTNPVARGLTVTNTVNRNKFLGNLYGRVQITDFLSFKSSFGGNIQKVENKQFTPTYTRGTNTNDVATARDGRQTYDYWDWKNYFTFQKTFAGKHYVKLLLGQEAQRNSWEGISANAQGFLVNDLHSINLGDATTNGGFSGYYTMSSYYTRLNYTFENKYGLTATLRADGSSKFDKGHRWGYFPSVAAHWSIYKEPFMEGFNKYVDDLTFKAGYGITGNQDIGNFLFSSNLTAISTGFGQGFAISNISNPDLQWERQKQLNLGLTFSLFNDRVSANVEAYNKISDRFLYSLPLPSYLTGGPAYQGGINPPTVNLGKMQNKGIEVTLEFNTVNSKDFSWNSTLTYSHFKNKVKALNNRVDITEGISTGFVNSTITRTVRGKPVGLFYGYKVKGLFRDSTTIEQEPKQFGKEFASPSTSLDSVWAGDIQYKDVNEDGKITQKDRTFIGDPHPDFTFGFNNSFHYKNINLSIFIQGSYGNDIFNASRLLTTGLNRPYRNQLAEAADYWTPDNPDAEFPRPLPGDDNNNIKISDRFIEDGTYMRIKNLRLGYTLPQEFTQKFLLSRLHIYGSVQNLLTITGYSGYDPDVGAFNQSALRRGVDFGRYPEARIFTLGLNVDF